MITKLRFCKKCKRETIQVAKEYVNSQEYASHWNWLEQGGKSVDIVELKAQHTIRIWYCPSCGKHWKPDERRTTIYWDEEFKGNANLPRGS